MIRIRNRSTKEAGIFMDQQAVLNNSSNDKNLEKFTDHTAVLNNARSGRNKIALPEEFTMQKEPAKPKNEYAEYLKTSETHINSKLVKKQEDKVLKILESEFKPQNNNDRLDIEIYKYENKVKEQKQQSKSLLSDIATRTENYIKQFAGFANNSIFQNLVGITARIIAPPPDANQILTIKDRIKRLDPTLITDIYTISQIVQSPELMAYIRSLYEHVKNNVATNTDLQYILDIVKPIIDYISVNSDKFSMSSSPWLLDVYQKLKGSLYIPPIFSPGTPAPVAVTTAQTTFNFQSDSASAPTERHTEAQPPAQTIPSAPMPQYNPEETQSQIISPPLREPLVGSNPTIYNAYTDAFTSREKLEQFYASLISVPNDPDDALMQIRGYLERRAIVRVTLDQIRTTPTAILTANLMGALENTRRLPAWAMLELSNTVSQINNNQSFFFQPLKTSQEQTPTPDYNELKTQIFKALESRLFLEEFIVKTIDDSEFLKQYPLFKNYIINESNKLTNTDIYVNEVRPKILFDLIYNGLVVINDLNINSDFIPTISNQMERLASDPKFQGSDKPYEFSTTLKRLPLPITATPETRPQSIPTIQTPNKNLIISSSGAEPMPLNMISAVGPSPINKNQILSIKMKEKETNKKMKEFIKQNNNFKLDISDKEAIKITKKILENSETVEDVGYNVNNFFSSIIDAIINAPGLSLTIISTILKYLFSIRNVKKPSDIPRELIKNINFDISIMPKALLSFIYDFGLRACKGNFKQAFEVAKIIYDSVKSETVEIAKDKLKNINRDIANAMEQGLDIGRAEGEALAETAKLKRSIEIQNKLIEEQKKYLNDTVKPQFNIIKNSINIDLIRTSFEEYKKFYIEIQKLTSKITLWLRNIGAGNQINITPLTELDKPLMKTEKLLRNFNSKDFKTVWERLNTIYNLSWDVSDNFDYQTELEIFSKELTSFILPIINKLRYNT